MSLAVFGTILELAGANKSAKGQERAGELALERGREQRTFNEIAASQVFAVGQREAFEDQRQAKLMASRAVAVAAAGGAVADIDHLIADIYGEGAYRASLAMHAAESEAERLRFAGAQAEQYGMEVRDESKKAARGTRLGAVGSLFNSGLCDSNPGSA